MSINIQFEFSCPGRYGARHMLDCDVTPLDHHRKPYKICYESQGNQLCFGTRGLRTPFATVTLDRPPQVHIRGTKLQRAPFSGAASEFLTYMDRPEGRYDPTFPHSEYPYLTNGIGTTRITRMKYGDTVCFWKNQHRNGQVVSTSIFRCSCGLTKLLQLTEFEDPRIGEPYASWSRSENGTVDLHYYQRGLALGIIYPIIVSVIIEIYGLNLGDGHHCSSKWMWDQWFLWYKDTGCLPDPNLSHHFGTPLRDQISTHLKNLLHHRQENLFHSLHNPYQYKFNFRNHGKTSHVLDCDLKSTSADGRTNMPDFTIRCTPEVPDHLDFYMRRKEAPYGHFASLGLQTIQDAKLTIWSEEKRVFEWLYYNDYKKWYGPIFLYPKFAYLTID